MRTFLLCLITLAACLSIDAQPQVRAIMLKDKLGYNQGDTIQIKGYNSHSSNRPNKYVVFAKSRNRRLIAPIYLKLIDSIQNFWDYQWFLNRSGKVATSGHYMGVRTTLDSDCKTYLAQLRSSGLLEERPEAIDYLNDLVKRMGPPTLIKGMDAQLKVYVIRSEVEDIFSFDNGSIFITTALLVNTPTEEGLVRLLSQEISHIVNDDQVIVQRNRNVATAVGVGVLAVALVAVIAASNEDDHHDSYDDHHHHHYESHNDFYFDGFVYESYGDYRPPMMAYERPSAIKSYYAEQDERAKLAANMFVASEYGKMDQASNTMYMRNISGVITYEAWNKYFKNENKEALRLIERLESNQVAGSDDYLLKAKIYRKLYNTDEARYEALQYIQKAKDMKSDINIDLLKEEGLIYYQLNNMPKAHASFEEYRYALDKVGVENDDDRRELSWANQMLEKTDTPN